MAAGFDRCRQEVECSFFNGRSFVDFDDLKAQLARWLDTIVDQRRRHGKTPLDRFAEEREHLVPLPRHPYDTARVIYLDPAGLHPPPGRQSPIDLETLRIAFEQIGEDAAGFFRLMSAGPARLWGASSAADSASARAVRDRRSRCRAQAREELWRLRLPRGGTHPRRPRNAALARRICR
jgi:hypothetical protein